jgi:hypothetical protein
MSKKLSIIGNYFVITDTISLDTTRYPKEKIRAEDEDSLIRLFYTEYETQILEYQFSDLVDSTGAAFASIAALFDWLDNNTGSLAKGGTLDVILQDSTAPLMIVYTSKLITETTLTSATSKEDYIINIASAASFAAGQYLTIYDQASNRVFFSTILSVNVLAITLDTPLDFEFPTGSFVSVGSTNMNVDGSVTPQIFGIRNPTGVDVPLEFDISRIMVRALTTGTADLSKFGDIIGGLLRGVVLRRVDGEYRNIFNLKTNGDLANIMYDFDIVVGAGNQQDGFFGRFTFAGQSHLGAVVRVGAQEDLQVIIQDDLSSLIEFTLIAEGSIVVD